MPPISLPFTFRAPVELSQSLERIEALLDALHKGQAVMESQVQELLKELGIANQSTNEIQSDVSALLARLDAGGLTAEETATVLAELRAHNAKLASVAAQYPPPEPVV